MNLMPCMALRALLCKQRCTAINSLLVLPLQGNQAKAKSFVFINIPAHSSGPKAAKENAFARWWSEGYFWADLSCYDKMAETWMYLSWIFIQRPVLSSGICIILVHLLIKFKLHFLPESVAVVSLGKFLLYKHDIYKIKAHFQTHRH